jgi:hypothetical protein
MPEKESPESRIEPIGPMYATEMFEYLRDRNHTSFTEALNLIFMAQRYGPELANAKWLDRASCEVRTHIGYGLDVVFEMDRDRNGKWQPVLGKIVKP